jgi:ubiquinone biosynthesis protein UbiJ
MLTRILENLLNRGLPRSPRAQALCQELTGKSLAIEVPGIARLRVSSNGATLSVSRDAQPADATLCGGPLGLLALAGSAPASVLQRGGVAIGGDAELAQKFRDLLKLLRPDLEEELSLVIGDVPAHQLARLAQRSARFGARAADITLTNAAEFLGHERADLVPRNEGEQFLRGVDGVREDLDRLEARLELLARRRGTS